MNTIDVEVKIDKTLSVTVDLNDVIEGINEIPLKNRWNYIAKIINGINVDLSDITDEQREMIEKYLFSKLQLFKIKQP